MAKSTNKYAAIVKLDSTRFAKWRFNNLYNFKKWLFNTYPTFRYCNVFDYKAFKKDGIKKQVLSFTRKNIWDYHRLP